MNRILYIPELRLRERDFFAPYREVNCWWDNNLKKKLKAKIEDETQKSLLWVSIKELVCACYWKEYEKSK